MDDTDKENLTVTLDALIDRVVKLKGFEGYDDSDIVDFMYVLDEAKFIVAGIVYSNGISVCDHEKDPVTGECLKDEDD